MSEQLRVLQKKLKTMGSLKSIIRTLKVLAALQILSYEKAITALQYYYQSIELSLMACVANAPKIIQELQAKPAEATKTGVLLFGSDQGMVGQFNDLIAEYAHKQLADVATEKIVWPIGKRVAYKLQRYTALTVRPAFALPTSKNDLATCISRLIDSPEERELFEGIDQLYVFYNKPKTGVTFEPAYTKLLPLDSAWIESFITKKWPTQKVPELINGLETTFENAIRQYLFISIIQACAQSMISENTYRLAAMQVAEKHIDDQIENDRLKYNQARQAKIDEEIFDLLSGFAR